MDRRRKELLGWIEETKRNQRTLGITLVPLGAIAFGLLLWSRPVGAIAIIGVIAIAICGFWVMAAHNAAHHQKLEELAAKERQARRAAPK
jgi:hypothetical protein